MVSLVRFELTLSSASGLCHLPVGLQRHELFNQSSFQGLSFFVVLISHPEPSTCSVPVPSTWNHTNPLRRDLYQFASTHPKELSILFDPSRHVRSSFQDRITDQQNHQAMSLLLPEHQNQDRFQHLQQTNVDIHKQGKPTRRE